MPPDSVADFLAHARDARLLPPDQLDELARHPDAPADSLPALADFLLARGAVTPFQADLIRAGRGRELTVAGYALTGELGPCPGGAAYRGLRQPLRTPLVVRRVRADWLGPADDPAAYAGRAREASPLTHPHLAGLLDAGLDRDEPFVVLEPFDGTDLETLVREAGPLPVGRACGFARQAALGLQAAHDRGLVHGDVRPANLRAGPLADGRPAPDAVVKVFELGLVPRRPAADLPADHLPYLAPERRGGAEPTPAADVYGLGATLFHLLAGRPPGDAPDLKEAEPDVAAEVAGLVREMLSEDPGARPTLAAVADRLAPFADPVAPPAADAGSASASASDILGDDAAPKAGDESLALLTPAPEPSPVPLTPAGPSAAAPDGGWVATAYSGPDGSGAPVFAVPAAATESGTRADPFGSGDGQRSPFAPPSAVNLGGPARRKRAMTAEDRARLRMWFVVGIGLWLLTIPLWFILLNQSGCIGGGTPDPASAPKPQRR